MPDLAAVVAREHVDVTIQRLRHGGVYDDERRVLPAGDDRVAIPVTAPPDVPHVIEVVEQVDPAPRRRDLADYLRDRGWGEDEVAAAPSSWGVVGDVALVRIPEDCPRPGEVGEAIRALQGVDTVLARNGITGETRDPDVEVIAGSGDTETVHTEHGTRYALDLAHVMFSPGNKAERVRMGEAVTRDERVLDMFAGIGYFTLPMARAGASVTAVEIDPTSYRYLVENTVLNGVEDAVTPVLGDCRDVDATAERVVMGHYDAADYLDAALDALEPGGTLHLHAVTPDPDPWTEPEAAIDAAAGAVGRDASIIDRRTVKTHAPGVVHVVLDARV